MVTSTCVNRLLDTFDLEENCLQELSPVGCGRGLCFDCFGLDRQHTEHKYHLQRVNAPNNYTVLL